MLVAPQPCLMVGTREEALRSASFMVDQLGPRDRASLVVYDQDVEVLVPSSTANDKSLFRSALNTVYARGTTALFDGWNAGGSTT